VSDKLNNVIFDFGNVIIRWRPYRALSGIFSNETEMQETLSKIGFFDWNLKQDQGRSWEEAMFVAERDMPEHAHIFRAYVDGLLPAHSELVPGTSELIEALDANGRALFGMTNAAEASFGIVKQAAPVIGLMRDVVVSATEGFAKPDPRIFELCLLRNGLPAGTCLFVDDSLANCQTAQKLGIVAHHFTNADGLKTDLLRHGLL